MAARELIEISLLLRKLTLERWTSDKILDHVSVSLPAPVFDRLQMDLQREIQTIDAQTSMSADSLAFGGIKYKRVPGAYWSIGSQTLSNGVRQSDGD